MGSAVLDVDRSFLNKWEMYKALQGEDFGPCKLPQTAILKETSLQQMVKRFRTVYVKPVTTWGGQNISVVRHSGQKHIWKKQGEQDEIYDDFKLLTRELVNSYAANISIVQQAAPLVRIEGRPFDIRVHMQRQADDTWTYAGSLARIGGANSLVSNVAISNGAVTPVKNVLSVLSKNKGRLIQRRLEQIGHRICSIIDNYREFDEVGIDLGVDAKGRLWLIEVNTDDALGMPSHELFAQLPDRSLYEDMQKRYENRQINKANFLLKTFFELEDLA